MYVYIILSIPDGNSQIYSPNLAIVFGPTLMWPPAHLVSVKKGSEYTKIKLFYYLEFLLIS